MNQQLYTLADAPAQRVITDVMAKLSSLLDINSRPVFNTVLPLTQAEYTLMLEQTCPAAFVYFGEEAEGWDSANEFDELYFYPNLEILFLNYIPNNNDGTYPDVQRYMTSLHWKVIQNLRVPTDDITTGIPYQKTAGGKVLWEFRTPEGEGFRSVVQHRFDVRTKWIENGRAIENDKYLHSIRIGVQVNNFNAE